MSADHTSSLAVLVRPGHGPARGVVAGAQGHLVELARAVGRVDEAGRLVDHRRGGDPVAVAVAGAGDAGGAVLLAPQLGAGLRLERDQPAALVADDHQVARHAGHLHAADVQRLAGDVAEGVGGPGQLELADVGRA